jgi:hypothetical protein
MTDPVRHHEFLVSNDMTADQHRAIVDLYTQRALAEMGPRVAAKMRRRRERRPLVRMTCYFWERRG